MLTDVVIDTNVLMHADDPRQAHQADALGLLEDMLKGTTALCVDTGFDMESSKNTSRIGHEYLERLSASSTGYYVLTHLASSDRLRPVSAKAPQAVKKCIEQCVRNARDRTFLAVAHNSTDRTLCSHDLQDMQVKKRAHLKKAAEVLILGSAEVRALVK